MKWFISALLAVFFTVAVEAAPETPAPAPEEPIEITSDGENNFFAGVATAEDNVVVRYKGDVVYCDRLTYNMKTKTAICKGNVRIFSGEKTYRGDTVIYNFQTKEMQSADFRMSNYPMFVAGDEVTSPGLNHYRIRNGFFTTDNRVDPAFKMRAHTIEVYPGDHVVLKNIVVYAGPVPVMWLPIYSQSLTSDRPAYQWTPGSSGSFGAYLYNKYNWQYDKYWSGTVHLDVRQKRGFAGGADVNYFKNDSNKLKFRGYYAQDNLYSQGQPDGDEAKYAYPNVDNDNRYRVSLKDRFDVGPDLSMVMDINKWSDPFVTLDFFENEYEHERQPDNFVDVVQYSPHYTFSLMARSQVNKFFETVEREPEAKLSFQRQKLFKTPISYEGENSVTSFKRRFANTDTSSGAIGYDSYRYDTFHQFLYPKQYFNWLNITPRMGLRGTYWSDTNQIINDYNSDGYLIKNGRGRFAFNVGTEMSFKVSRVWSDVESKEWGIYGLRHVAEPFINPQMTAITGTGPDEVRGFDDRLASTRLAPINYPEYNSVDSIDNQKVVRYGIRNKIQTKRDNKNVDLVDWVLYADLDIDKNFSTTTEDTFSNVFNDITLNPLPWLSMRSQWSSNVYEDRYSEYNNDITWQITRAYRVTLGNRYISGSDLFPNSNLLTLRNFYRMNEHWQFESYHAFEAVDGQLQEQAYTVFRDLSAWQISATFKRRFLNDKLSENAFYLTLTLKAFPETELSTNTLQ